ncbi:hypothetical protein BBP40_009205 [Aspergillus hancockii]|nr:hypothetical protein BBP40_009205 [Aspergillus hancockii]
MPSASAQAALIRQVYSRAGLDPTHPTGRCQYFKVYRTGVPTGEAQEAKTLGRAYFPGDNHEDDTLYVGSVKTAIGHTKGTAGIASLLKAYLALKHKLIPPNLHFELLNPKVAQFTHHLRMPTTPAAWPQVFPGRLAAQASRALDSEGPIHTFPRKLRSSI